MILARDVPAPGGTTKEHGDVTQASIAAAAARRPQHRT